MDVQIAVNIFDTLISNAR